MASKTKNLSTSAAFTAVRQLHAMFGAMPCTWGVYRIEAANLTGVSTDTLDAMMRIGVFHITETSVCFAS